MGRLDGGRVRAGTQALTDTGTETERGMTERRRDDSEIISKRRQTTHRRLTCVICHRWRVRFNCSSTPANVFMFRPPISYAMPCFGRICSSDYSQNLEVYFQGDYDSQLRTREMEPPPGSSESLILWIDGVAVLKVRVRVPFRTLYINIYSGS